jgi:hypothetical protein
MGRTALGLVLALGLLAPGGPARADDEPVLIGEVIADPDAHHMRLVLLQGTVRQITQLPPYSPATGTTCYGAYTFTLEDETGSIEIGVLGFCGAPVLRTPEVREGEPILLKAQILSPNRLTSLSKGEVKKLRAVANEIRHVAPVAPASEEAAPSQAEESPKAEKDSGY